MDRMLIAAVLLSVGCGLCAKCFLSAYFRNEFVRGFWLKGAAAMFFVVLGAACMVFKNFDLCGCLIVAGLSFGLVGDQLLAMRMIHKKFHDPFFIAGALSFGVGHVLYMIVLQKTGVIATEIVLPLLAAGVIASLLYAVKSGTDVKEKTPLAAGYIVLVLLMASLAVCVCVTTRSAFGVLFAIGGILFAVSDNILCAYCYGRKPAWSMNRTLHIAYYGAQLAIAWSILFI